MTARRAIVRTAVVLTCLFAVWAMVLGIVGGIDSHVLGVRISTNDPMRPLLFGSVAATLAILVGDELIAAFFRRPSADNLRSLGIGAGTWIYIKEKLYRAEAPVESHTRPVHVAWATLGLSAFGVVLLYPQLQHMMSVPDLGDPLFSVWRLGWVFHQLQGDPRGLFDANIFYPHPLTLTYSDSMLLPALFAAPFLAMGIHPVIVYNVLFLASFIASGVAMFLLASHLTGSRPAAFISALIFGFYPYRFEHYSHFELQMTMWMPLALLALHRFVETLRKRYAVLAALAVVAQLYSSMYYGVFFTLYVVPVAVVLLLVRTRPPLLKLLPGAVLGAALAVACVVPLAKAYFAAQGEKGERDVAAVTFYSAEISDYFEAHDRSVTWERIIRSENPERALFPGAMALLLTAVSLFPPLGPMTAVYGVGLAVAFECSFGFHGWVYPILYDWFSPIRGMRVAARFSILTGMTLSLLAAFGTRRILRRIGSPRFQQILVAAFVVALAFDLRPRLDLEPVWTAPPTVYASLPKSPKVVLAEYPIGFIGNLPYMYFSVWHWANMVNGYSGFSPKDFYPLAERIDPLPEPSALEALRAAGVTHITVNCALYDDTQRCAAVMAGVEESHQFRRLVQTRWHGGEVALYELR